MTSVKVVLYTSKILKNGEHPVILRLTKDRKQKKISLGFNCLPAQWDNVNNTPKKKHPHYKELCITIDSIRNRANREILNLENEGKDYSLEELANILQADKKRKAGTIFEYFEEIITRKEQTGKVGYANAFIEAKHKLSAFRGGKDLEFSDVTFNFLKQYEDWLISHKLMPKHHLLLSPYFQHIIRLRQERRLGKI
jgi:integrase/recombinase XerD